MLGYALRKSSQDTDRLTLLRVAQARRGRNARRTPRVRSRVIRTTPDGASLTSRATTTRRLPLFTDGMVHVGSTGELEYAVVPVVRSGEVVELVYAVRRGAGRRRCSARITRDVPVPDRLLVAVPRWPARWPPASRSSSPAGSRAA